MPDETRKVPLIPSEFGDFPDEPIQRGLERDGTYVPGFSEMKVARDTAVGSFLRGEIARSDVPTLPVNLRWARNQNKAGQPDNAKPFSHAKKGYRYVTKDDVNQAWLKEIPGGAQWDAAGNLRNGDTVLMVATAKDAARNESVRRRELEERMTGVTNSFTRNLAQSGTQTYKGADVYVEKLPEGAPLFSEDKP